jgi:glutaredoxin 3
MPKVVMYCTRICPYCIRAEQLLSKRGVENIEKIFIDQQPEKMAEMIQRTNRRTVPQIFIGNQHVGGFDDLSELDLADELIPMLQEN